MIKQTINEGIIRIESDAGLPIKQVDTGMVFSVAFEKEDGRHHKYEEVIDETV